MKGTTWGGGRRCYIYMQRSVRASNNLQVYKLKLIRTRGNSHMFFHWQELKSTFIFLDNLMRTWPCYCDKKVLKSSRKCTQPSVELHFPISCLAVSTLEGKMQHAELTNDRRRSLGALGSLRRTAWSLSKRFRCSDLLSRSSTVWFSRLFLVFVSPQSMRSWRRCSENSKHTIHTAL